jgi:hypothetical protein
MALSVWALTGRVADNTLQQNFVFAIASLALSTIVPLHQLQVVWACTIVYVVDQLQWSLNRCAAFIRLVRALT